MNSAQEFFYYAVGLGFLILAGFVSLAAYRLAKSLDSLKLLIDNIDDTARDINIIKNKIKWGALTTVGTLLGTFLRKRR